MLPKKGRKRKLHHEDEDEKEKELRAQRATREESRQLALNDKIYADSVISWLVSTGNANISCSSYKGRFRRVYTLKDPIIIEARYVPDSAKVEYLKLREVQIQSEKDAVRYRFCTTDEEDSISTWMMRWIRPRFFSLQCGFDHSRSGYGGRHPQLESYFPRGGLDIGLAYDKPCWTEATIHLFEHLRIRDLIQLVKTYF